MFLYDLTSTHFEGQALRNPKAGRGYSRDHRTDGRQVVVGLVHRRDTSRGLHDLIAARQPERDRWLGDFDDDRVFESLLRGASAVDPRQKETNVLVKLRRTESGTHVLCVSDGCKLEDRAIRQRRERRPFVDVNKLKARVATGTNRKEAKIHGAIGRIKERDPRVARYYGITYDSESKVFSYRVDVERRVCVEELDAG